MTPIAQHPRQQAGTVDVVVIGAGHAGLATSALLGERGISHVLLERGAVANAWRARRWASLRLLTPNHRTRLPGMAYDGPDPDGYMRAGEFVGFLERYAAAARAPVVAGANVTSVRREGAYYRVCSSRGDWRARAIVAASGACAKASVPALSHDVPRHIRQLTPFDYRSPVDIARGGVLVVGASATGLQFADELARAGHDVTLAVGEHVRLPRRYRGRNIIDWMIDAGISDERYDEVEDLQRGRGLPSPQLVGDNDRAIFDLNAAAGNGVRLAGRLVGVRDGNAQFSGSLRNVCALADLKMRRLLSAIDAFIGDGADVPSPEAFDDTRIDTPPPLTLDLDRGGVRTILWATGFRPDFSWLDVPVFDRKGRLSHDGGITDAPGLYVLGLPLMRRRKSSFIFGIEDDARDITNHLAGFLAGHDGRKDDGVHPDDTRERRYRRSA